VTIPDTNYSYRKTARDIDITTGCTLWGSFKIKTNPEMEQTRPFYDFSIPYNKDDKVMRGLLNELVECESKLWVSKVRPFVYNELFSVGYKTIAIDQSFDHSKKEAGKRGSEMFPEPYKVEHLRKEFRDQLRILQRITILYVDVNVAHAMVS